MKHDRFSNITPRKKGILISAVLAAVLLVTVIFACIPMLRFIMDPDRLRDYVESRGFAGILGFMGMEILQILTTIVPAGPFEMAAGCVFGPLRGTLISTVAMTIGSMIAFFLARKFGMRYVGLFVGPAKLHSFDLLEAGKKEKWIIFLCYLIPGLPKDLMTYAVGMTDLNPWLFAAMVGFGRIPSILLTAMSGDALIYRRIGQFLGVSLLSILFYTAGFALYLWYRKNKKRQDDE